MFRFKRYFQRCFVSSVIFENILFQTLFSNMFCFNRYSRKCFVSIVIFENVLFQALFSKTFWFKRYFRENILVQALFSRKCFVSRNRKHYLRVLLHKRAFYRKNVRLCRSCGSYKTCICIHCSAQRAGMLLLLLFGDNRIKMARKPFLSGKGKKVEAIFPYFR